jgi:hypothetical protein
MSDGSGCGWLKLHVLADEFNCRRHPLYLFTYRQLCDVCSQRRAVDRRPARNQYCHQSVGNFLVYLIAGLIANVHQSYHHRQIQPKRLLANRFCGRNAHNRPRVSSTTGPISAVYTFPAQRRGRKNGRVHPSSHSAHSALPAYPLTASCGSNVAALYCFLRKQTFTKATTSQIT